MDRQIPSISAVLPAYNEAAIIAHVVRRTHEALQSCAAEDHEVVVVDDGSSDGTGERVGALAAELPCIKLVQHPHNRGYGAALRSGFLAAGCDAVFLMDSDAQFDPADLRLLLPHYTPDTLVAGVRVERSDPLMRRANNAAFFAVVRMLVGPTLRDVNCAFKLFPRELGTGLRFEGAMISTELAMHARRRGYRIVEIPVPHYPRTTGRATGAHPSVILRAFGELWQLRREAGASRSGAKTSR
jgi:glycosyltransferase involved in cell wall biosynthesis